MCWRPLSGQEERENGGRDRGRVVGGRYLCAGPRKVYKDTRRLYLPGPRHLETQLRTDKASYIRGHRNQIDTRPHLSLESNLVGKSLFKANLTKLNVGEIRADGSPDKSLMRSFDGGKPRLGRLGGL